MLTVKNLLVNVFIVSLYSFFDLSRNLFAHLLCFPGQSSGENMGLPPPLRLKHIALKFLLFLSLLAEFPRAHKIVKSNL